MRLLLVNEDDLHETLEFGGLRLRKLFQMSSKDVLIAFVRLNLLQNRMNCEKCGKAMRILRRAQRQDWIQWVCKSEEIPCSAKSIRNGSFFANSNLPLSSILILCYMWAADFDNKHICRELQLDGSTVVDWLNLCREVCENYCNNGAAIGGPASIFEIDKTCFSKRKYNGGRRMPGNQQWIFGGIERGGRGKAFAFRVLDRTKKTLRQIIRTRNHNNLRRSAYVQKARQENEQDGSIQAFRYMPQKNFCQDTSR